MAQSQPAKVDTLQLPIIDKETAKVVLKAMQSAGRKVHDAEDISAKDGFQAVDVYSYFIQVIIKKWPDLVPKQK